MVRPRRCRRIGRGGPRYEFFGPRNASECGDVVLLTDEELEALRLCDHVTMEQTDAAQSMGISQPTFSRTLQSARRKIAKALIEEIPIVRVEKERYLR